jgi:predicted metal-dependent hydrolase
MSKKSPKIAALIADCTGDPRFDPHYLGYFKCFNRQWYYEAHDVLEELWLADRRAPDAPYYQGLIQVAGAFVHLKKNHEHPRHQTHSRRIEPAARLFRLALRNFQPYSSPHAGFDLDSLRALCADHVRRLEADGFQINSWSPENAPQLTLP